MQEATKPRLDADASSNTYRNRNGNPSPARANRSTVVRAIICMAPSQPWARTVHLPPTPAAAAAHGDWQIDDARQSRQPNHGPQGITTIGRYPQALHCTAAPRRASGSGGSEPKPPPVYAESHGRSRAADRHGMARPFNAAAWCARSVQGVVRS